MHVQCVCAVYNIHTCIVYLTSEFLCMLSAVVVYCCKLLLCEFYYLKKKNKVKTKSP